MKGRRKKVNKTRKADPVEAFIEASLTAGQYALFYCAEHGKHFMLPGKRPQCPVCDAPCFTEDEWLYRNSTRRIRERRIQMLRNNLEG